MKTNLLRRSLLLLAMASSFIPSASALVPNTFLGAITPGESHAALIQTSIQLAYDDQGVTKSTKSMKNARTPTGSIEQCGQILRRVSDETKQVKRVRKTLKKNLHFRPLGSGHLILRPGWYSDFDDAIAACSDMRENDIPVLVSLVAREKQGGSVRVIAYDILRILHTKALPCIEAGMAVYPERVPDFSALKSTIERDVVEISHNPAGFAFNPKSCQMQRDRVHYR